MNGSRGYRRESGYGESRSDHREGAERPAYDDRRGTGDRERTYSARPPVLDDRPEGETRSYRDIEARENSPSPPLPPPPPRSAPPPRAIAGAGARRVAPPVAARVGGLNEESSDASEEYEKDNGGRRSSLQEDKAEVRTEARLEQSRRDLWKEDTQMKYEEEDEDEGRMEEERRIPSRAPAARNGAVQKETREAWNGGAKRGESFSDEEEPEEREQVLSKQNRDRTSGLSRPRGSDPAILTETVKSGKREREEMTMQHSRSVKPDKAKEYSHSGTRSEHERERRQPVREAEMDESDDDVEGRGNARHVRAGGEDRSYGGGSSRKVLDEYEGSHEERDMDADMDPVEERRVAKRMKVEGTAAGGVAKKDPIILADIHDNVPPSVAVKAEELTEKQLKQKRKEEKRLRKEERRKKREEKRKRKEEKRAAKGAKQSKKAGEEYDEGPAPLHQASAALAHMQAKGPAGGKQGVRVEDKDEEGGGWSEEEDESADEDEDVREEEQKRLEEALRRRAMEALRGKKRVEGTR
eukprot:TRINITY_DN510_c0_g1_i2.p1 TRINITY_DN510_c0_g1~~TRINITY_DN510_c0_g1_i2.p1  ORF type:complete len:525 (+),score=145.60 TRINITY_DN510_c0_g1_i2:4420-5994(+)